VPCPAKIPQYLDLIYGRKEDTQKISDWFFPDQVPKMDLKEECSAGHGDIEQMEEYNKNHRPMLAKSMNCLYNKGYVSLLDFWDTLNTQNREKILKKGYLGMLPVDSSMNLRPKLRTGGHPGHLKYRYPKALTSTHYFKELEGKDMYKRRSQHVIEFPKLLYQTWSSWEGLPKEMRDLTAKLRSMNPEYKVQYFNATEQEVWMKRNCGDYLDVWSTCKNSTCRTELFRYCILFTTGGVWVDVEMELLVPLKDILQKSVRATLLRGTREDRDGVNEYDTSFIASSQKDHIVKP